MDKVTIMMGDFNTALPIIERQINISKASENLNI